MPRQNDIRYEQAVYGSFPFWDRGYAILAQSPGCRPEWLTGLRSICQRYGEPSIGAGDAKALFTLELEAGPRLIVGVGPQGRDDRGRPGALAFHALFLDPRDYHHGGGNPFDYAQALRYDWNAESPELDIGFWPVERTDPVPAPAGSQAESIANALTRGRRVAIQTPEPIDTLARQVWTALPVAVRCRASVATWAFGNSNRFDLVALPRLTGVELDASYIEPGNTEADAEQVSFDSGALLPRESAPRLKVAKPLLGVAALLLGAGLGLALRGGDKEGVTDRMDGVAVPIEHDRAVPDVTGYRDGPVSPEERARVIEGLVDMGERFGVLDAGDSMREDPTDLMTTLAARLRYRGPWLTSAELAELEDLRGLESNHDRELVLSWHRHLRQFAADRPLPERFRDGPMRWQLDTLEWSFHLDDAPERRRSPGEIPHALTEALAVDFPLVPNRLSARHPALAAYLDFLNRLPRR